MLSPTSSAIYSPVIRRIILWYPDLATGILVRSFSNNRTSQEILVATVERWILLSTLVTVLLLCRCCNAVSYYSAVRFIMAARCSRFLPQAGL